MNNAKVMLATTIFLAATPSISFAQDTVRMGTEGAYPPYNFINDNGEIDGLERELGDELCRRVQLTCVWVNNDWDSIIPNLVSGNYDTIMAGMTITSEREEVISFTQNYVLPTASAFVALSKDVDPLSGIVAVQANTVEAAYVAEAGAQIVEFATPDEAMSAVRNGEADSTFADKGFLEPIISASSGELSWIGDEVRIGKGIGIGLRQSDNELKDALNAAIASMKADGSLNALLVKWLGQDADQFE